VVRKEEGGSSAGSEKALFVKAKPKSGVIVKAMERKERSKTFLKRKVKRVLRNVVGA